MAYSSITKPGDYFNTKLYTGNGSTQSITGVGFQPDWVWSKSRTEARGHNLNDVVRGSTKWLGSNDTSAELTVATGVTSFDSDGFSLGSSADFNNNTQNYVSWNWLAGGSASSNTDGSITSSVSANTTSGFSIVSYSGNGTSGATVGHGLGSTPKMIIARKRNTTENWIVYNEAIGNSNILLLNTTAASTADNIWTSSPTSSVFSIHSADGINGSGGTYIAYCFAEKKGFSEIGSYVGNGNTNGTFVYTGFKPAFTIIKRTDSAENWHIFDNKRDTSNPTNTDLRPNLSNAETSGSFSDMDFLSNGFKFYNSDNDYNAADATYIYMAFAENPLVANVSGGLPATAR